MGRKKTGRKTSKPPANNNGNNGHSNGKPPGGTGGRNEDSGRTVIQDERMLGRAIKGGWLSGRWDTQCTASSLQKKLAELGELPIKDRAIVTLLRDVASNDPRISQIAVRNLIAMEGQNQADEHHATGSKHTLEVGDSVISSLLLAAQPARVIESNGFEPTNGNGNGHSESHPSRSD